MKGMRAMTRRLLSALLCLLLLSAFAGAACAISAVDTSQLPEITITTDMTLREGEELSVTADGLPCENVTLVPDETTRQTIVMLDLTDSVTRETFDKIREALKQLSVQCGQGETLVLYTFGEKIEQRLAGGESPEQAAAVIDSLEWDVRQTDFYDAVIVLCDAVNACPADVCVPVLISDGVDNASTADKAAAAQALQNAKSPVNAFCGDSLSKGDLAEYVSFVTGNKGILNQMSASKVETILLDSLSKPAGSEVRATLPAEVGGKSSVTLQVSVGDITEVAAIDASAMAAPEQPAEEPAAEEPAAEEPAAEEPAAQEPEEPAQEPAAEPQKDGISPLYYAIGGLVIVLLIAALIAVKKKGSGKKAAPAEKAEKAEKGEKPAKKEKKKNEPKVTFYFEDKK